MSKIDVDAGALLESSRMLLAVSEDLRLSFHRIEGLRSRTLGSRRIDGALNHFADHWKYGWGVMETKLKEDGTALGAAATQYHEVEGAIAQAFMAP